MNLRTVHSLLASLLLGGLTACQSDGAPAAAVETTGEPLRLCSGILTSPEAQVTRAEESTSPLTAGTAVQLYVEGTWTGKGTDGTLIEIPRCTAGANLSDPLRYTDNVLYWDDYGTGDPNNTAGKEQGLNIYALAIDGLTALPSKLTTWASTYKTAKWATALSWAVSTDGTEVLHKDLLVANNLSDQAAANRLKFDTRDQNQLQFRHVLSKITFRLTAGTGFEGQQFTNPPEVKLTRNKANETSEAEYALTSGTVDVPNATATATPGSASVIIAQATRTDETDGEGRQVVTEEALLYPGSVLGSNDTDLLARINADDNIYYITAKEIRAAITALGSGQENEFQTQPGYNYVIRVTVHKTDVEVTASVTNWTDIEATEVAPVINVSTSISKPGDGSSNDGLTAFDFYLSTARTSGYGTLDGGTNTYTPNAVPTGTADGSSRWSFGENVLYWPNHQTHYHFRGVYPTSTTVEKVAEDNDTQVIKVWNGAYDANTFPSNLLVGMPEIPEDDKMCANPDHTAVDMSTEGICATEGTINLNFRYPLAQVKVKLTTTEPGSHNHVNIGASTEVALVNVHTTGQVLLGTRKVEPTGSAGEYELDGVTDKDLERHSIIVPQSLTFSSAGADTNLRFRIKVTNEDSTTDTYYADVQPIPVKVSGSEAAAAPVNQWESGKAYVYTLKLTKTEIKVSASLTDWTAVEGGTEVWF